MASTHNHMLYNREMERVFPKNSSFWAVTGPIMTREQRARHLQAMVYLPKPTFQFEDSFTLRGSRSASSDIVGSVTKLTNARKRWESLTNEERLFHYAETNQEALKMLEETQKMVGVLDDFKVTVINGVSKASDYIQAQQAVQAAYSEIKKLYSESGPIPISKALRHHANQKLDEAEAHLTNFVVKDLAAKDDAEPSPA
ncbi:hypothetical protein IE81DRAFT_347594 [Ceraceosorus guamensis]|uniref:Uncharacterized protein n=1 Tax=Ceraceosorus guamensis TaxID=1522189 RepID=A0A316W0T3_9BASI|nr:hypothetical protein IE81DRAFT_347594 [Ceraceosorus guamensis]PWN42343.1 hypothetical protein IE81DRAFT_347594 [Ceraceosorus guamensis]